MEIFSVATVREEEVKLALYVHDLKLEIGHSNSLIELIRHLPAEALDSVEELEVVSFTTAPPDSLFPQLSGRLRWVKVPFAGMRPVLLKSIFFQLWTFLYNRLFQKKRVLRIGIGISCLDVNAVSVQFIHHQWTERGLQMESDSGGRLFYKKILFSYFEACENFLFSKKGLKVFSPAKFLTKFFTSSYDGIQAQTIYSGVNLARFELGDRSKQEILETLLPKYPVLAKLDVGLPIFIFVGAYERKGLADALDLLKDKPGSQFIVIGSPSTGRSVTWPSHLKIFPITFTKEVSSFYELADTFIFPTLYEPFGLVLFEAMAMGLKIITRKNEVGASELLDGLPEVFFSDIPGFIFPETRVSGVREKRQLRDQRLALLGDVSWTKAGGELSKFLDLQS